MPSYKHLVAVAAGVVLLSAPSAWAQDSEAVAARKVDSSLRQSLQHGGRTQRVIITVRPGYRADIREAIEAHGDRIKSESALGETLAAEIHSEDVTELAKHPWVEAVSDDATVYAGTDAGPASKSKNKNTASVTEPSDALETTLRQTLGLPKIATSNTPTGDGIGVAIIDSGITPNADFAGRITGFYDFTRDGIPTAPYDDYGHGTHVAGLIGSSGVLSNYQLQGIAPDVNLVGLKVLDKNGQGRTSDVIKAIEYVTVNKSRLRVQVINLSLGHPIYAPAGNDPLVRAVEKATAVGLVVVISAGNFGQNPKTGDPGYTGVLSPGNAPSAITVGAAMTQDTIPREDDVVAPYSSRGPTWFDGFAKPDVVAPGHRLTSDASLSSYLYTLVQKGHKKTANGQDFLQLSGTSMAAGVTSGVVAVILDANRRAHYYDADRDGQYDAKPLTANAVKAILEFSTIPIAEADPLTQGTGEINAIGAIRLARAIDTSAPSGAWWLRGGVHPYSRIGGVRCDWSQAVIWGDDVFTGTLVYYNVQAWSLSAQWGDDNIVWGTNDDDNIVWGTNDDDNIVWGTNIVQVWAANIVWPDRVIGQMDDADNIVWGTADDDNIVWGTLDDDNIVWGTYADDNIVWGTSDDNDNIVWGTTRVDTIVGGMSSADDNIVWGTSADDNIVWGTAADGDNIVWGTADEDNIVWGTSVLLGGGIF